MKKKQFFLLRMLTICMVAFGLIFTTGCGDDEDGGCTESTWYEDADNDGLGNPDSTMEACEQPDGYVDNGDDDNDSGEPDMTVWEIIEANNQADGDTGLDSLEKYLRVYPDLMGALENAGTYTVFTPTNSAFISLLATPGFPSNIADINPDIIKNVLAYHVSPTEYSSEDLSAGTEVTTISNNNETIEVNEDGTLLTGATNKSIEIVEADIAATNGVVHLTGSVLIPPSVGATLTPILGTNAGTLLLGAEFSILGAAILKADTFATGAELRTLTSILAGTTLNTVFAPSNAVFEAIGFDLSQYDGQTLYGIVAHHVVFGEGNETGDDEIVDDVDLVTGATFTSAAELPWTVYQLEGAGSFTDIFIDSDGDFDPTAPDPQALNAEVAVPYAKNSDNGTVHAIAGLLVPPTE